MAKIEKEVKILDINPIEVKEKLIKMGAIFQGEKNQKIYVYDLPTLYYRYLEIRELLKTDNQMLINTNLQKLEVLLKEFNDLISEEDLNNILTKFKLNSLKEILNKEVKEILNFLNTKEVEELFKNLKINPNKWIRLRQSNDKVALTSKHILNNEKLDFQNVSEIEFEVSSFSEANLFLESIGICKRSYQEKIRYSYVYKDAEIEIDIWPLIKPYLEIECDDKKLIEEIITKLELNNHEVVSLNTEELYRRVGIDVHSMSELKFK